MTKRNSLSAAGITTLLSHLREAEDAAAEKPLEEVCAELGAMGVDINPALELLKNLLTLAGTAASSENRNCEEIIVAEGGGSYLAMAAADSGSQIRSPKPVFHLLGEICIDGADRALLTDGRRVAIPLTSGEHWPGIWIDATRVGIQTAAYAKGNLAILSDYMLCDADSLLAEPAKHVLRWDMATEESGPCPM